MSCTLDRMPRFRAVGIHAAPGLRIVALESRELVTQRTGVGYGLYARLDPVAVIIIDAGRVRAVGADAKPVSLDRLRRKLPLLDELIAPYREVDAADPGE